VETVTPEVLGEALYLWSGPRHSGRKHLKTLAKSIGWPHRVGFLGADAPTRRLMVEALLVRIPITMRIVNVAFDDSPEICRRTIDAYLDQLRTRKLARMQDVFDDFPATYQNRLSEYLEVIDDPLAISAAFLANLELPSLGMTEQLAISIEFGSFMGATVHLLESYSVVAD
jgi:hypothetical protein